MYNVIFESEEINLLLNSNIIPEVFKTRLKTTSFSKAENGIALLLTEDEILELIHLCQDGYVMYGTDENYNPNKEGEIWDNLVIRLINITNA